MPESSDTLLTADEAYRAAYHFIAQYYERERTTPLMLMLHSMAPDPADGEPNDPATWSDWLAAVDAARSSANLPDVGPPMDA